MTLPPRTSLGGSPTPTALRTTLPGVGLPDVVVVLAILTYWTELLRILFPGTEGASAAFRLLHFAIYGAVLATVLASAHAHPLREALRAPMLLLLILLPMASTLWSVEPQESLQRGIALAGSSLLAIHLGLQRRGDAVLRLLAIACSMAAATSLFLILFVPSVGVMHGEGWAGTWSGAHLHKNAMGQMTALGTVVCLVAWLANPGGFRMLAGAGLLGNLVLLAGSRSLSAQVVCVATSLLVLGARPLSRIASDFAFPALLFLVAGGIYGAFTLTIHDLFDLLGMLGKDATMSSRVPLWTLLAGFISERWWLGYGYEAFWGDAFHAVRVIEARLFFKPHYAHNGIIELWLGLGAVGVGVFALLFSVFLWRAAASVLRDPRNQVGLLAMAFSAMYLLQNFSEATILARNNMNWVLFAALYLQLARSACADPPETKGFRLQVR